ncbi:GPW/gp25 family protein [Geobacillus kaustophilus]|uniref:GPW/gp25 family protein n=1 Tax=Geobacillus kaustophilus TaxID=1462 RepID=UPI000697BBC8|nr:GPW/gp25 family protein [Geobacillus kaustophilus]
MIDFKAIDYGATGNEEIIQNVRFILSTIIGSCVLDINLGVSPDIADSPIQLAQAKITAEIIEKIEAYEPRVMVESVTFFADPLNGRLIPQVKVVNKENGEVWTA